MTPPEEDPRAGRAGLAVTCADGTPPRGGAYFVSRTTVTGQGACWTTVRSGRLFRRHFIVPNGVIDAIDDRSRVVALTLERSELQRFL